MSPSAATRRSAQGPGHASQQSAAFMFEASALSGAECIEPFLLLVVERLIELLDHGLYRARRLQHGIEALMHGLDPPDRCARQRRRARRLENVERARGSVSDFVERGALGVVRLDS